MSLVGAILYYFEEIKCFYNYAIITECKVLSNYKYNKILYTPNHFP